MAALGSWQRRDARRGWVGGMENDQDTKAIREDGERGNRKMDVDRGLY